MELILWNKEMSLQFNSEFIAIVGSQTEDLEFKPPVPILSLGIWFPNTPLIH